MCIAVIGENSKSCVVKMYSFTEKSRFAQLHVSIAVHIQDILEYFLNLYLLLTDYLI